VTTDNIEAYHNTTPTIHKTTKTQKINKKTATKTQLNPKTRQQIHNTTQ
jgi:hypothetical protein